jgi:signal transduction histidine kinase
MLLPPPEKTWSLASRLAWRLSLLMFGAIALAAAAIAWGSISTLDDLDDAALQQQVQVVASALPPRETAFTLPPAITTPFQNSDGDNLFIVYGADRTRLATSDTAQASEAEVFLPRPFRKGFFRIPVLAGHKHGMIGYALPAGLRWVIVLQGREQSSVLIDSLVSSFFAGSVWVLLPIFLAAMLVSVLTLHRGLRPIMRVSATAAAIGAQPGIRLPLTGLPREVTPLVEAVNEALTRLEQTIATQRRFMAEAAHGLRTPLAVLTARLDALDAPQAEALRQDAGRMSRLVSQLLSMARLESLPLTVSSQVDLRAAAVEAISTLAPIAVHRGIDLALLGADPRQSISPQCIQGNHDAIVLALTNLVENALNYAPYGSAVEIILAPPATISVRDCGPGIPPEDIPRLLQPFQRGATAAKGGAGLGLAIVSRIAAAHGGTMQARTRPTGGCVFTLTFPTAAA